MVPMARKLVNGDLIGANVNYQLRLFLGGRSLKRTRERVFRMARKREAKVAVVLRIKSHAEMKLLNYGRGQQYASRKLCAHRDAAARTFSVLFFTRDRFKPG